jgi:hypothetical protein
LLVSIGYYLSLFNICNNNTTGKVTILIVLAIETIENISIKLTSERRYAIIDGRNHKTFLRFVAIIANLEPGILLNPEFGKHLDVR